MFTTDFFIDSFNASPKDRNPAKVKFIRWKMLRKQHGVIFHVFHSSKAVLKRDSDLLEIRKSFAGSVSANAAFSSFAPFWQ